MKQKVYKHGTYKFTAYFKPAGNGWEVGFKHGTKPIFMGNFVHKKEANEWYTRMNNEIASFSKKYWVGPDFSMAWYQKFFSKHLYQHYYTYVDKVLTAHQRDYKRELTKDVKRYKTLRAKKTWTVKHKVPFRKSA